MGCKTLCFLFQLRTYTGFRVHNHTQNVTQHTCKVGETFVQPVRTTGMYTAIKTKVKAPPLEWGRVEAKCGEVL